jgi:hypothetical protein
VGAKLACGATLSATREFVGVARLRNSLVVEAMITTRELLAPYELGFYFAGQFFACPFCGKLFYFTGQFRAGFFPKTTSAVLAERSKSEMEKVK